jgi:hypothetical protein
MKLLKQVFLMVKLKSRVFALFFFSIIVEVSIIKRGINHFNSVTFLCLYQTMTWISIAIYRVLFVFNDLWWGGNLLVMLMELLAIKCCLNFIFINQLHKIPVISLVCFYVEYVYSKPYQMPLKDHKEETTTKQLLSLFYVEVIIQFYGMNFLRFGYTHSHSSLFT